MDIVGLMLFSNTPKGPVLTVITPVACYTGIACDFSRLLQGWALSTTPLETGDILLKLLTGGDF